MRKPAIVALLSFSLTAPLSTAQAWWDGGHRQVAYVAYQRLRDGPKEKADQLLRLNPSYQKWIAGAPDETTARMYAFVHAASWADDIKMKGSGYTRDDPNSPTAGQNIGYADRNQHDYWHYKDIAFSPDGTIPGEQNKVDAVTQLKKMIAALPTSSGASDDVRSYDLVWMLHIVGDLHQPLHATARYTRELPAGDRGGNEETVIPATGEVISLHAYWDRMFGGYSSAFGAVFDAGGKEGIASLDVSGEDLKVLDPEAWASESKAIAENYAYAPPVSTGANPVMLTREYETRARTIARARAALAGARLAEILNEALK